MLACGGLLLGRTRAKDLWDKAALLRELARISELLRAEVDARQPLQRVCVAFGESLEGAGGDFFRKLGQALPQLGEKGIGGIWRECATECFASSLTARELRPFCSLGDTLSSGEGLERSLGLCANELTQLAQKAEETAGRDGKMWTTLGLASGVALGIVLV